MAIQVPLPSGYISLAAPFDD